MFPMATMFLACLLVLASAHVDPRALDLDRCESCGLSALQTRSHAEPTFEDDYDYSCVRNGGFEDVRGVNFGGQTYVYTIIPKWISTCCVGAALATVLIKTNDTNFGGPSQDGSYFCGLQYGGASITQVVESDFGAKYRLTVYSRYRAVDGAGFLLPVVDGSNSQLSNLGWTLTSAWSLYTWCYTGKAETATITLMNGWTPGGVDRTVFLDKVRVERLHRGQVCTPTPLASTR